MAAAAHWGRGRWEGQDFARTALPSYSQGPLPSAAKDETVNSAGCPHPGHFTAHPPRAAHGYAHAPIFRGLTGPNGGAEATRARLEHLGGPSRLRAQHPCFWHRPPSTSIADRPNSTPKRKKLQRPLPRPSETPMIFLGFSWLFWSGRGDSNARPSPWQNNFWAVAPAFLQMPSDAYLDNFLEKYALFASPGVRWQLPRFPFFCYPGATPSFFKVRVAVEGAE
jgi:hypothetical protein